MLTSLALPLLPHEILSERVDHRLTWQNLSCFGTRFKPTTENDAVYPTHARHRGLTVFLQSVPRLHGCDLENHSVESNIINYCVFTCFFKAFIVLPWSTIIIPKFQNLPLEFCTIILYQYFHAGSIISNFRFNKVNYRSQLCTFLDIPVNYSGRGTTK